ncbi:MAG: ATP-binding protein [Pseudomonadota bacterium]
MILVPVTPFILTLGIGYSFFTKSIENSTIASMKRIVRDHAQMIDSFLHERKANLEFILDVYSYESLADPEKIGHIFHYLEKKSSAFVDLGVFNAEGIHVNYNGPYKLVGKDYAQEDWFKEVMKEGYYISDIFLGFRRIPHYVIALKRVEGDKKWVLRSTIDTYMFNELVKRVLIGKTGEAYILNSQGVFQTERRSGGSLMEKDPESLKYSTPHDGIETFIKKDERGDEYLYATTWLKDKKWFLVVRQEKADAFSALRSATYLIVFTVLIGGAGIIAVAFYLTNRIVRRMEKMDAEKDQLGVQLVRATQLAELGEMAAGFAHEINNPLQIVRSEQALIETILSDLKGRGDLKESKDLAELEDSIDQIRIQIDRCAQITQAILKFGRRSEPVSQEVDLREFIPEMTSMVEKKSSVHGITLTHEISDETPFIKADPAQLQQVLLNLLNNAIDAILVRHGSKGGELYIGARAGENGKAEIFVKDNGCGISNENLKKIFTPFFTTKPVGKGTGLGLSVCYGIIDKMGGVMEFSSEKGVGTTFTIRLPAAV